MIKSDAALLQVLTAAQTNPYVEFKSDNPEGDRQKLYRLRRRDEDEMPLLAGANRELIMRTTAYSVIVEWKEEKALEMNTEKPIEILTKPIETTKPKKIKIPQRLELRLADFRNTMAIARANPEYYGAWQDLYTLVVAGERLVDVIENGGEDEVLWEYVMTADKRLVIPAFLGLRPEEIEKPDAIEMLRLQIAAIPTDDERRQYERLELIRRREVLMLERDKQLQGTNPLD